MKLKYWLASIPFCISVICLAISAMIGSSIDPDGILREPFFLIPIAYLFLFSGIISLLYIGISTAIRKKRT
ncbi:DUF3955 domain-containing protein [Paenibacillus guangzhouensis]|uniref:DUF3955 domain-containing protein n=1 Tax=Paenibacillus guangzhouensis TaxID=1473112 RepID=UPI001266A503|nr:DUF3955 domain-containing protein [Paenibacillus guangzhouensis]